MKLRLKFCCIAAEGDLLKRWVHLNLTMFLNKLLNLCGNIHWNMGT